MKRMTLLSLLFASACAGAAPPQRIPEPLADAWLVQHGEAALPAEPLPMRIAIKGVMAGVIDFSAHGVFTTATSEAPLTQDDWTAASLASINLIGAATLITSPGSGPNDPAWVADPEWRQLAKAYQEASVRSAAAIRDRDLDTLLRAANTLADACQACHDRFRITNPRPPAEFAVQMADRGLARHTRAWPAPSGPSK